MEVYLRYLTIFTLIFVVVFFNFCATRQREFDFANQMAKEGLWQEAYFRWQKIVTGDFENASLHNNIAIALEQMGKREEADKEYKLALKLAPENSFIKKNYDRFLSGEKAEEDEVNGEEKRKPGKKEKK